MDPCIPWGLFSGSYLHALQYGAVYIAHNVSFSFFVYSDIYYVPSLYIHCCSHIYMYREADAFDMAE